LHVSPDGEHAAEDGWRWHPFGIVVAWSLRRWLRENVWESEDGPSRRGLDWRENFWDGPAGWLHGRRVAGWGLGVSAAPAIPAAAVYDVTTGERVSWFAGPPRGEMTFDRVLFSCPTEGGVTVWDVATGERLLSEEGAQLRCYHRGTKTFLSTVDGNLRLSKLV